MSEKPLPFDSIRHQRIFISALDWGMGHLNRTAALIIKLCEQNEIIIFSSPSQKKFYSQLFPKLKQIDITSNYVQFHPSSLFKTFLHSFRFVPSIYQENQTLRRFIKNNFKPELIISDHRYGFYHPDTKNIFVTHQVKLQTSSYLSVFNKIHQRLLMHFDELWIPDYENEEESLAGKLSHPDNPILPVHYIQPQSLMQKKQMNKDIDYLFIISGTESERKYFEKAFEKISQILLHKNPSLKVNIIGSYKVDGHLWFGWKNFEETNQLMCRSKNIITRAGYTTLMDWQKINDISQQLYLINTPHQYEQQYLFHYWINKGWTKDIKQFIEI
ncbi:MAG: glycosyl transferase [Bacteroidia bacterium]|nr:MAG: glycosyl transferase [Bacteroidia bacterium]